MTRNLTILVLALFTPVLMWGFGEKPLSFSGVISDMEGSVIPGAIISIEKNGQVLQSTETDMSGNFQLKIEGPQYRIDQIQIRIQKKGYKSQSMRPVNGEYRHINIQMQRQPSPIPIIKPVENNRQYII